MSKSITVLGDPAPMLRRLAAIWTHGYWEDGHYEVMCPICEATSGVNPYETSSVGLIHAPDCPAAQAAKWLQENNR